MATTRHDSPGTGMRVGSFVLDIAAMGRRRRAPGRGDAPVEVPEAAPERASPPVAPVVPVAHLSFLERRAILDVERQHDPDLPPEMPDRLEDEVRGALDDLPGEAPARPAAPSRGRDLPVRPVEPAEPSREPAPSSGTRDGRLVRRSPLTPRAEAGPGREAARFPSATRPDLGGTPGRATPTGTAPAVTAAAPAVTSARAVQNRRAPGAPRREAAVAGGARPGGAPARETRDWAPARNVRDAQARAAAARDAGAYAVTQAVPVVARPKAPSARDSRLDLRIRAAIMADRDACAAIDTTYATDSVWQLDARQDQNEIRVGLRQITLPKPMAATEPMVVPFVTHADALWLVVEELEVPPAGRETTRPTVGNVVGFLTARIEPRRELVYLSAVAIAPDYRRQNLGSALIEHMRRWAARAGVPEVTADVSAKNAPALRLLQRHGFRFCGYSDRLYRNGEVALFLAMAV